MIKVLSNNNYTIQKIGTRFTQLLHRIRIQPYAPEQRIPDVTVRTNKYLPDPDVKVSHNEWFVASWGMNFGKKIDDYTTSDATNYNEQITTQETTHTDDADMMNKVARQQIEDTDNVVQSSGEFSNRCHPTWGITHIYDAPTH